MSPQVEMKPIQVDINLGKNEYCYIVTEVKLFEEKKVTKNVSFLGMKTGKKTETILAQVDAGALYITSKRILFVSSSKSQVIMYKNILDVNVDGDGMAVVRETGPIKYYKFLKGRQIAQLSHDLIDHFLKNGE